MGNMDSQLNVRLRQGIERVIIKGFVKIALAAGYTISVHDGEEVTVHKSKNKGGTNDPGKR